ILWRVCRNNAWIGARQLKPPCARCACLAATRAGGRHATRRVVRGPGPRQRTGEETARFASCTFGAASRGDDLPSPLVLFRAGSVGPELVEAYRRFGSRVSIVAQGRQAHRRVGIGRADEAWLAESRTTR